VGVGDSNNGAKDFIIDINHLQLLSSPILSPNAGFDIAIMGKDHPDADLHPEATGLAAATVKVGISCL
jgi:hypothetical protein